MRSRVATATFLAVLLALTSTFALAGDPALEETDAPDAVTAAVLDPVGPIQEIRAPLTTLPAITAVNQTFRVEVEAPLPMGVPPEFGLVPAQEDHLAVYDYADLEIGCLLDVVDGGYGVPSEVWADQPDLRVLWLEIRVKSAPWLECTPGAYDLVMFDGGANVRIPTEAVDPRTDGRDVQRKAVHILEPERYAALASGEAEPKIVVLADPQVGDPRPFQDAAEDVHSDHSHVPVTYRADGVVGDGSSGDEGRWKAFRQALRQAADENPDFLIVAGDLTFGQAVPNSYAVEYAELYEVLLTSEVPIFLAPGNHDGYVQNGVDGFAFWRAFIGPTYYLNEVVPGTHLLVMNTYDWSELDRMGASFAVSAWGGQVRDEQLAWMHHALANLRTERPDDRVLSVSHHSPSWRQDPYREADPTNATARADGTPVAEQVTRGAVSYGTTDQAWAGENRLELRDTLRAFDVEIAFAGHTHMDRVARDDGTGQIVETHQSSYGMPDDYDPRELHYFDRNDQLIPGYTQEELTELIRTGAGPLYVDTTAALSGTVQYWGYRVAVLEYDEDGHLVLENLGEPMTEEDLQALARHPELFNPAHSSLGLFSKPLDYALSSPWAQVPE